MLLPSLPLAPTEIQWLDPALVALGTSCLESSAVLLNDGRVLAVWTTLAERNRWAPESCLLVGRSCSRSETL